MQKENKNTSRRGNKRESPDFDNRQRDVEVPGERGSAKPAIGSKRYCHSQRESLRKETKAQERDIIMTSESLQSISGSIIESGIKYIMFPLYILRFCLFGTSSAPEKLTGSKEQKPENSTMDNRKENEGKTGDKKDDGTSYKRPSKQHSGRSEESDSCSETKTEVLNGKDSKTKRKSEDERITNAVVDINGDFDFSTDGWSSASSTMIMNMSVDYDNINKCMSFPVLEESTDISMEETMREKPFAGVQEPWDNYTTENVFIRAPWFYIEEQDRGSVDEEIVKIFEKQCTTENPLKSNTPNNLCHKKRNISTNTLKAKKPEETDKRRRKKAPFDVVHTKRKSSQDYDKNEKHGEYKNGTKLREEKYSSRQDSSSKSKTKSSKNPVKDKGSKQKDVKYKNMATQTDSAFSDNDVEMVPVDMKLIEKQYHCKRAAYQWHSNFYQDKEMEQELNYVEDNEDTSDRLTRNTRQRISSCSTSSSSTDLGFDEYMSVTSDADTLTGRWNGRTSNTINPFRICNRAPPGFPELPQNPPLTYTPDDSHKFKCLINNYYNPSVLTSRMVPRAPSPMRHLYYDYPEFMDRPRIIASSKILGNITSNYYR